MINVPILAVPNQSFTIQLDEDSYTIALKSAVNIMACDVTRNGAVLLSGARVLSNQLLIPYPYLYTGNFVLVTQNEEYPIYSQFGISQYLIYFSELEIQERRSA